MHPHLLVRILLPAFLLFSLSRLPAQVVLHGTVTDRTTGEVLVGANLYDTLTLKGTVTNSYGFYSLQLPASRGRIRVSYVGYNPLVVSLEGRCDTTLYLSLEPAATLEAVSVHARQEEEMLLRTAMGSFDLDHLLEGRMPSLMGETDLIKSVQLLPGVGSGMEGTSGLYVRGGGSDQNLVLLDGVPLYNVNHLFGFFSLFNGSAINKATLYKGGFPARYGGRLSSVLDIRMKEGNMHQFHGSASVGIISSDLMLEGPLVRGKTSFLVSGRRTYLDLLSYPVQYIVNQKEERGNHYFGYFFHDFHARVNHTFSPRSRLFLSTYTGKDRFYEKDRYMTYVNESPYQMEQKSNTGFSWGNLTSSIRWNYIWGSRLFSNLTLTHTRYGFENFDDTEGSYLLSNWGLDSLGIPTGSREVQDRYHSGISDLNAGIDLDYAPVAGHYLRAGAKWTYHRFVPGRSEVKSHYEYVGTRLSRSGADSVYAHEAHFYLEDEIHLGEHFQAQLGLHGALFLVEGERYHHLEPRISLKYKSSGRWSAEASLDRMAQYVHLLTNSTIGLPMDLWVPTTAKIAPETAWQTAAGVTYDFHPDWQLSVEGYYKKMKNLLDYAEGAGFIIDQPNWEDQLVQGRGTSYGAECFLEKRAGKWTGWLGYTLSKTTRSFPQIDEGRPFPYKYDRRHDISLVLNYTLNDRISLSGTWVYGTGTRVTMQDQSYLNPLRLTQPDVRTELLDLQNEVIHNFTYRNGYQLPDYHRLDLGMNIAREKGRTHRTWSFGVYNAYNRMNALYLYSDKVFDPDKQTEQKKITQVTLFPIIPYVRCAIEF